MAERRKRTFIRRARLSRTGLGRGGPGGRGALRRLRLLLLAGAGAGETGRGARHRQGLGHRGRVDEITGGLRGRYERSVVVPVGVHDRRLARRHDLVGRDVGAVVRHAALWGRRRDARGGTAGHRRRRRRRMRGYHLVLGGRGWRRVGRGRHGELVRHYNGGWRVVGDLRGFGTQAGGTG